jgi:glycosyltransferase involved in cell wall biosynthesis
MNSHYKVALVTDWLTNLGGGEKVLEAISDLFPSAPLFTTVVNHKNIGKLSQRKIIPSFLQKIPVLKNHHQFLLPLLPLAIESFDLSSYDLVISFSSSIAKSVLTHPHQIHICYIHSPMRYAWEPFFDKRFSSFPKIFHPAIHLLLHSLRNWDQVSSLRPDLYITNSSTTEKRVQKYYNRDSKILYPPVDISEYPLHTEKKEYYLGLGRMVSYKKFDLLVETFRYFPEKTLVLIGDGPERKRLSKIIEKCPNILLKTSVSHAEKVRLYQEAKAFILPQKEDAGIVQLEACSTGTPVIAFQEGGALDVIQEGINGVFFQEQTKESLIDAVLRFEQMCFQPEKVRESVACYDLKVFQKKFLEMVEEFGYSCKY